MSWSWRLVRKDGYPSWKLLRLYFPHLVWKCSSRRVPNLNSEVVPYTHRYRLLVLLCEGQACACSVSPQNLRERTLNFHFAAADACGVQPEEGFSSLATVWPVFLFSPSAPLTLAAPAAASFPTLVTIVLLIWLSGICYLFLFFFFAGAWLKIQYIYIYIIWVCKK